jgi:hypothetical protein
MENASPKQLSRHRAKVYIVEKKASRAAAEMIEKRVSCHSV